MATTKRRKNSDEDFPNVGPDATATFDNSRSNPTEHASSENLDAIDTDEEEEDLDDEGEEEEYDEEEDGDDDEDDGDGDEDDDDEDEPGKEPRSPSVYRKV